MSFFFFSSFPILFFHLFLLLPLSFSRLHCAISHQRQLSFCQKIGYTRQRCSASLKRKRRRRQRQRWAPKNKTKLPIQMTTNDRKGGVCYVFFLHWCCCAIINKWKPGFAKTRNFLQRGASCDSWRIIKFIWKKESGNERKTKTLSQLTFYCVCDTFQLIFGAINNKIHETHIKPVQMLIARLDSHIIYFYKSFLLLKSAAYCCEQQ